MSRAIKKKTVKSNNTVTAYDYTKDIRSYLKSTLFNSYYLERGFFTKFKDSWIPSTPAWDHFYKGIVDFIESKDDTFFFEDKPSESMTIDSYIKPVMALLGWDKFGLYNHYDTETTYDYDGKPYRPDLVYFEDPNNQKKVQTLKGKIKTSSGKQKKEYQRKLRLHVEKHHNMLLEAKMFGVLKPNSKRKDEVKKDSTRDKTPEGQVVTYMDMLKSNHAILTDGGVWKFFHNDFRSEEKFVSFDFGKLALWLLKKRKLEDFELDSGENKKDEDEFVFLLALFYNLFSKEAVFGEKVEHLVEHTAKYSEHLDEKIKTRFVMAMTHACNGLAASVKKDGKDPEKFLELIQKTSESHLFNIIFLRSLESRGVLPYFGEDNSYDKISISKTVDTIYENGFNPSDTFKSQLGMFEEYYNERVESKTTTICGNLLKLYKSVHDGISNGIKIKGFKDSVFSEDEWKFAKRYKIADEYMMNVIFYLNLVPKDRDLGEYQLIPFDFLTPREIGSIFESFLEFKIEKAKKAMFWDYKKKQWLPNGKVASIRKNEVINKNEFFFAPNNKDKKMTGAYYTPELIVDYIVKSTLDPIVKGKKPSDILKLRICDPAMGSGHFLKGVLDYLSEKYVEAHFEHEITLKDSHQEVLRKILNGCIYGVDINKSAVKLAKMSMWLATAKQDQELQNLEKQLLPGDSLCTFDWRVFGTGEKNKFDAIVGNPPYVGEKGNQKIFAKIKDSKKYDEIYDRRTNTYYYFMGLTKKILKNNGLFGYIIPSEWKENVSAVKLRSFVSKEFGEVATIDFCDLKVFKNGKKSVGTSSLVCIYRNGPSGMLPLDLKLSGEEIQSKLDDLSLNLNSLVPYEGKKVELVKRFKNVNNIKNIDQNSTNKKKINVKQVDESNFGNIGSSFHIDQGIVSGVDLITKKNKYVSENWSDYEQYKNSGVLILKVGQDILLDSKGTYLNMGTLDSPEWEKLNSSELACIKPLFKNKDITVEGYYSKPSSYVIFFEDKEKKISLSGMPTLKKHLTRFKDVLTASKTNCYHNKMLKNIMKPIVDRGNYFVVFYPRPKTDFSSEKIVFVCDQGAHTFAYSNSDFYGSGGNKGGLSFITKKGDVSLKFLFAYFLSDRYKQVISEKSVTTFLSGDFVKKIKIPNLLSGDSLEDLTGEYKVKSTKGYNFDQWSGTYVAKKGLVDLYLEIIKSKKNIKSSDIKEKNLKRLFKGEKVITKEIVLDKINLCMNSLFESEELLDAA